MPINLPSIDTQQLYVDVYNAMLANQRAYERGLEDFKLTCDAYIDELRCDLQLVPIGGYINLCEAKNENLDYQIVIRKGRLNRKDLLKQKQI